MSETFSSPLLPLPLDRHGTRDDQALARQPSVPMYTPRWYAQRVLNTTAQDWWTDGVPPARGRRQRARQAVAGIAAGMVRRLQPQVAKATDARPHQKRAPAG